MTLSRILIFGHMRHFVKVSSDFRKRLESRGGTPPLDADALWPSRSPSSLYGFQYVFSFGQKKCSQVVVDIFCGVWTMLFLRKNVSNAKKLDF